MKTLNHFIGLYPLSKTLRFSLIPVGKTEENFYKSGILERDEEKANNYPAVKRMIDECHKYLINESLSPENARREGLNWIPLKEAIDAYRKDKSNENKTTLEAKQTEMRKSIFKLLKENEKYKNLTAATPKDLLKDEELLRTIFGNEYDNMSEKDCFKGFATYFKGFQENRQNIYTEEDISTAVPFRAVHDNFPKFLADIEIYENIKDVCPEVLTDAENELLPFLDGVSLEDVFSIDFYNSTLNQNGIDYFNQIIGGVTEAEGEKKLRGINEFVNLYRQQHPELKTKKKALIMVPLFKQILSDRESSSFIPQSITSDKEMIDVVCQFHKNISFAEVDGERVNIIEKLCSLISSIKEYDLKHIYINGNNITDISQNVYKYWSHISDCLKAKALGMYGDKSKTDRNKVDAYTKRDVYSADELSSACAEWTDYFGSIASLPKEISDKFRSFEENVTTNEDGNIGNKAGLIEIVKELMDAYMNLLHKTECLAVSEELDLDKSFYTNFTIYYETLRTVIPLYTKVRNYLTQKPFDEKKFKINFDAPTLADGWDKNKEKDNKAIMLFKDGYYYLAISAPKVRLDWDTMVTNGDSCYSKMVYKFLPDPKKTLPHVFFSKKGVETYRPSQYIIDGRNKKRYSQGTNFDLDFLHNLIDFYKESINNHPDWGQFGFKFSPTHTYENLASFYNEITSQGYKVSFVNISANDIDMLVNEGKLFLFKIFNKDYSEGSHGKKNLHTLYWENIFNEENLKDTILKLNGEAEIFFRKKSIVKPFVHRVGEKLLNKRDKSGMPIPDSVYHELYNFYNGKISESELTNSARQYKDNVIVKDVTHEIVKDRRYTQNHFQFHVPFTINYLSQGKPQINDKVLEYLKDNPDVNIIGLDRGERHLIYLTLINQKGEILKQKTFNIIDKMNYQAKLTQREKERDDARKSWQTIGKIKELKEGYLSAVIHEIASMMVEYNAIVVMEDLNFGFKRGRFKVERQVYQKFEKMLIDKLNYLPFKDCKADADGGILRGYQLANKFESFQKLGKQSGFIFYIPAAYTSKIDPVSGFVNIFDFNELTNATSRRDFFSKFDSIKYISDEEGFEFTFNYDNFKTHQTDYRKTWTVSSAGKRIVMQQENGIKVFKDFYPTKALADALRSTGIVLKPGMDVKPVIDAIEPCITSASFFSSIFYAFKATLQMRNSNAATEEDYIQSPVKVNGKYFNSDIEANKGRDENGDWISKLPVDADANGAYHIALKGLYTIMHPKEKLEHAKWLEFMQTKPY